MSLWPLATVAGFGAVAALVITGHPWWALLVFLFTPIGVRER